MNRSRIAIVLLFACHALLSIASGGCQHRPPLERGRAGLELRVVAEPKSGLQQRSAGYDSMGTTDTFAQVEYESLAGIIVWIEPLDAAVEASGSSASAETAVALNEFSRQPPPWHGVAVGARLVLQNRTARAQSVYSLSDGNPFDLGTLSPGQQAQYVVKSSGPIEVLSESSPQPLARLYAVAGERVQTVRANETARLPNLSPGRYRVACWHERLPGSEELVGLSADKWSTLTLKVSVNLLPAFGR